MTNGLIYDVKNICSLGMTSKKNWKENYIGHFSVRPPYPNDIKMSDKNLWVWTTPYPTLILTNEDFGLNLKQI